MDIRSLLKSILSIKKDGQAVYKNCTVCSQENDISLKNPVLPMIKLEQEADS